MLLRTLETGVVGAPMAGGPTSPELVAAVGEAGGLGFLAAGYLTAPPLASAIAEVWDASPRPFGVTLVVRERVPLVSFTIGLPSTAVLGELRRAGIETVATVTEVDEAAAALSAGVDGLCLQGPEGGGHRGTLDP